MLNKFVTVYFKNSEHGTASSKNNDHTGLQNI